MDNEEKKALMREVKESMDFDQAPNRNVQKSNMSFKRRVADWFYKRLENWFAPGCYYIGRYGQNRLAEHNTNKDVSSIFILTNERDIDFGNNVRLVIRLGKIFSQHLVVKKIFNFKLYFFNPIKADDTGFKIALGMHSFVENDTIVFDVHQRMDDGLLEYYLNIPAHFIPMLRSVVSYTHEINSDESEERLLCSMMTPGIIGGKEFDATVLDETTETKKVKVVCSSNDLDRLFPLKLDSDMSEMSDYPMKVDFSSNLGRRTVFIRGYKFTKGESIGFTDDQHKNFTLAKGETVIELRKDEADKVIEAVKALNLWACSYVPFEFNVPMDEIFVGDRAIYLRWHRGVENKVNTTLFR